MSASLAEEQALNLPQAGFDYRYVAAAIRANLLLITGIVAAAIAVAVIATMLQTPRYTASATVQINDTVNRVLNKDEDNQSSEMGGWDADRNLKTQIDILKSRGLAQRVVQKLNLAANPAFFASQEVTAPSGAPTEATKAMAAGLLQAHLNVVMPRDSRIVALTWESADPRMSALIANTYASEFIQANLQRKFDSSAYARNFVSEQLAETKRKVEESERALNDYARQNGLIRTRDAASSAGDKNGGSTDGGQSVTTMNLIQLNTALNEAMARRIAAEGRWSALTGKPLLSTSEVLNNGTVGSLLNLRAAAEADLQQEQSRHLEDYPTVQAKKAEIAAINRQLQQAATNVRDSVRAEYQAAAAAEARLAAQVNTVKGATLSEQDSNVRYSLLAREADTNRQLYDGLLQRYKELNASAGISLSNISIVDSADVPGSPSSPNLGKNLLAALIIGLVLAGATVFFKDQFDDSIRVPEDVEAKLGMPLLGVVPKSLGDEPEIALTDPKSPVSEAYNSLRGSLLYSTPDGLPQVILLTSAQPSEGKTTSSYAIASSFARMGKTVLLIDADLRRPSLHRQIGYDNARGFSTLLTSHEPLASAVMPSGLENLTLLTSGAIPPSPTELLSSLRLEQIIQEAARQFQVVIIDSPPILGLADSPTMAALADGVVFVVEAGRSRRGALKTALRRLRGMRPVMLGVILTKFDPLKAGNRYSEYYGYEYYQYGSQKSA
ncbi:polysaccharide biosynthesis tyrosine autokinase [Novosphingobium flavum]|uniref:non-specific protein-tyrosine kinase n=2 Tax=Novosphingobium flavum TaxID=1778672 RepID=A0A7X1FPA2_9SPHN|nr:polysaccharide biosynthesis tyrosine autokinase [Novosphingobium flavum]MBC2664456.1 polysaccharide biosynthesis tyrosine autokinase [Novosphingobium flavum]